MAVVLCSYPRRNIVTHTYMHAYACTYIQSNTHMHNKYTTHMYTHTRAYAQKHECKYVRTQITYSIAGFVCEVLICVNYASCCASGLANFNFAVSYSCIFVSAHCTCHSSVLVISLSYVSVQILQKSESFCFTAWPKRPKDCNGCVNHVHDDIAALLQCSYIAFPNILVDIVSSDHRVYSNNDLTSQAIACDSFSNLV